MAVELQTIDLGDRVNIARDTLRGREADYYRLTLLAPSSGATLDRLKALEHEIVELQEKVAALEAEAKDAELDLPHMREG